MKSSIFLNNLVLSYKITMMNKILFVFILVSTFSFAEEGVFYIEGEAVKSISLTLGASSINFGDVYTDTEVDPVSVDFYVDAESSYDYQVEISNDDSSGVVQISRTFIGGYTGETITYTDTGTGDDQTHEFYVDLDTTNINSDLSATITIMVVYFDII